MNYSIKLLNTGINETEIARHTRICYGKFGETGNEEKTLKNLIKKEHLTPFELSSMTFKIECPIYVQRQIMRHRTGSFLEKSLRYTKDDPKFGTEIQDYKDFFGYYIHAEEKNWQRRVKNMYSEGLKTEKPEDARKVLTLDTLTEFIFHIDLRNLMHFFSLRLDKHAQKETRKIAKEMFIMFCLMYPITAKAFTEKEAKLINETFTQKELGTIWPVPEPESKPDSTSVDTGDSERDRVYVSDDTLVPEKETVEVRNEGQSVPMGDQGCGTEDDGWDAVAVFFNL